MKKATSTDAFVVALGDSLGTFNNELPSWEGWLWVLESVSRYM